MVVVNFRGLTVSVLMNDAEMVGYLSIGFRRWGVPWRVIDVRAIANFWVSVEEWCLCDMDGLGFRWMAVELEAAVVGMAISVKDVKSVYEEGGMLREWKCFGDSSTENCKNDGYKLFDGASNRWNRPFFVTSKITVGFRMNKAKGPRVLEHLPNVNLSFMYG
mmetsp:Transcript_7076/g.14645  ORF Transcript_7076/g.14645 Transcript_7076/m.14645 type:complete len:162 (+) Transcript_7076:1379-1864(+)